MTKLSVNVNKIATLRNSRGKNLPDVLETALSVISFGAHGITVHPRPDGRHIRRNDVYELAAKINIELNIEGYPSRDFLDLIREVKPAQCTLVPDPPDALTSNAGWLVSKQKQFLKDVISELHSSGVRTSIFMDPKDILAGEDAVLKETGTERVELYTEAYADAFPTTGRAKVLALYSRAAELIKNKGVELNAGHDLNLDNLNLFIRRIPYIREVSIGHALICDALKYGMEETVKKYLDCLAM